MGVGHSMVEYVSYNSSIKRPKLEVSKLTASKLKASKSTIFKLNRSFKLEL